MTLVERTSVDSIEMEERKHSLSLCVKMLESASKQCKNWTAEQRLLAMEVLLKATETSLLFNMPHVAVSVSAVAKRIAYRSSSRDVEVKLLRALIEINCGAAILEMASSVSQDRDDQDRIRLEASKHAVEATRLAAAAASTEIMQRATETYWNAVCGFLSSPSSRQLVSSDVNEVIELLHGFVVRCGPNSMNPSMRSRLYRARLDFMRDISEWERGTNECERFMPLLPAVECKTVLEMRLIFLSRLGRANQGGVSSREGDIDSHSKVGLLRLFFFGRHFGLNH